MANTPNVRFKGFADDWEQHRLETVSDVKDGTHDSPTYQNEGHPFVTSKNVKNGFINYDDVQYISDEDFEEINKRSKVDVNDILMGMIGTIGNLALIRTEPDFAIKNVALIKDTKQVSYLYLYQYLQSKNVEKQLFLGMDGGTQKFLALKKIRKINILMPSEDEQLQIGRFLENLDYVITLHQRKCDEVKQLKKFMLQKMFPRSGELIPEIRFAGFTGDWEQRKFGTMFKRRMERNNGQFDNTRWISVAKMYFQEPEKVTSNNIDTRTYVMRRGDIAFEGHSNAEYKYGRFVANDIGDGIISELFPIYMHIDDYDEAYWKYAIQIEEIMASKLLKCIEISYTSSNKLDEDFFLKEEILVPSLDEQQQIGTYFRNLDHLITLHQHKCDQLKEVKRFMLQNMFPQKG